VRIITLNLNGIRSAQRKGFFTWLATQQADIVCVQEIKAHQEHLTNELICPHGYYCYFVCAEKKGYSGVGIYSRHKPDKVITALGFPTADQEGRFLQLDFPSLSVISLYLPSGTSGEHRQLVKYEFMAYFENNLQEMCSSENRQFIICGDWNIAHKPIDLKNWRANQKNSGFLPRERAWLDTLFDKIGWVDAFRVVNQQPEQYTWWSHRGQAWAKNVGWRIDYQIITPNLREQVIAASIYKEERFSDHAPLIVDYDWNIT
jgi:exodeoxyribonuclease-3